MHGLLFSIGYFCVTSLTGASLGTLSEIKSDKKAQKVTERLCIGEEKVSKKMSVSYHPGPPAKILETAKHRPF